MEGVVPAAARDVVRHVRVRVPRRQSRHEQHPVGLAVGRQSWSLNWRSSMKAHDLSGVRVRAVARAVPRRCTRSRRESQVERGKYLVGHHRMPRLPFAEDSGRDEAGSRADSLGPSADDEGAERRRLAKCTRPKISPRGPAAGAQTRRVEPDAGSGDGPRHALHRSEVPPDDAHREETGGRRHHAADAGGRLRQHEGRRPEGDLRVPEDDQADQERGPRRVSVPAPRPPRRSCDERRKTK